MSNIDMLQKYFHGGSAELEKRIRHEVFIQTRSVEEILSKINERFIIIKSQKGVGKSYIIDELVSASTSSGFVAIKIKPSDMDIDKIASGKIIASKIKSAYENLVEKIALAVGCAFVKEELPLSDAERNLYSFAVDGGHMRPELADRVLMCLTKFLPYHQKIAESYKTLSPKMFSVSVLSDDIKDALKAQDKFFWIFIDDIDLAIGRNGGIVDYEACWAIIAAAFDIASNFNEVRCVVSVRNDVWHSMKRKRVGSDRRDKMTCIINVESDDQEIDAILSRRLEAASQGLDRTKRPIELFFDNRIELPGKNEESREWRSWLCKQARNRPRDLVQLVEKLAAVAKKQNGSYITSAHARCVLSDFARQRIENVADELSDICGQFEFIVSRISRTYYEHRDAIDFFKKLPSAVSLNVDGSVLQPDKEESAIAILRLLHIANFMNPRVSDPTMPKGYRHIMFHEDEDLISITRKGELSRYAFEVHPVFHSFVAENKR